MYRQIKCIHLYANDGQESKTKDSVYNMHLNFWVFSAKKKGVHFTWVNMV